MNVHGRVSLNHLDRMTDSTGLIQHAIYGIPRRESGYTTDDNARALRLCVRLWRQHREERILNRAAGYLSFLEYARCPGRGFHNFLSYDRRWLDAEGCGDCQGQAVRALAEVLGSDLPDDFGKLARELIDAILPALADLRSLRAQAYVILAWGHLWRSGVKDVESLENVAWSAAERLVECYNRNRWSDWHWFESRMTYANAVLPHALFIAAHRWPKESFLEIAKTSFDFLDRTTTAHEFFQPVGNKGWYLRGEEMARYDQQPVEAATMAEAALAAFDVLAEAGYLAAFHRAHAWFHGENSLSQSLVDIHRGVCCDGLQTNGVNRNQGAESMLAYLWTESLAAEHQDALGDRGQSTAASA